MSEPDRCYICLGSGNEPPPLARSSDSSELIQVCKCSLRAHRRCLTDWASDMEYRSRDEPPSEYTTFLGTGENNGQFTVGIPFGVGGTNPRAKYRIMQTKVKCPQCGTPLFVAIKPSKLLNLHNILRTATRDLTATGAMAVFGSAGVFALSVSVIGIFVSGGLQMFLSLAPESVLTKLLGLKSRNMDKALRGEEVGFKQLFLLGSFPMFLFGLRSENAYMDLFSSIYPTLFFNDGLKNFLNAGPKAFLLFAEPLKRIYWLTYSLTFNKIYYNWTRLVKPIFLADRLSAEELEEIEEENKDSKWFKLEKTEKPKTVFQRLRHYLFNRSPEDKALERRRLWRDLKAVLLRDYTSVFDGNSFFTKLFTTMVWPFLGAGVGKYLVKIAKINSLCNHYASTPDEATYISNLLGSLVVVLLKDLIKLFIAWNKVNQLLDINVVEHQPGVSSPSQITQMANLRAEAARDPAAERESERGNSLFRLAIRIGF